MATIVTIPTLGAGARPATLAEWYLEDGGMVQPGQALFRLESDFVAIDVEAESQGLLRRKHAAGTAQRPGEVVAVLLAPGEPYVEDRVERPRPAVNLANDPAPARPPIPLRRVLGESPTSIAPLETPFTPAPSERSHFAGDWSVQDAAVTEPEPVPVTAAAPHPESEDREPNDEERFDVVEEIHSGAAEDHTTVSEVHRPEMPAFLAADEPIDVFDEIDDEPSTAGDDVEPESYDSVGPATVLRDTAPFETAVFVRPAPLTLKTAARMAEAAKLGAQLTREWRATGLAPAIEDVVLRACGRAAVEGALFEPPVAALVSLVETFESVAFLEGAGHGPFREQVAALAASREAEAILDPCFVLTSLASFTIDEGDAPLADDQVFGLTLGSTRLLTFEGGETLEPGATITLSYRPDMLTIGEAATLLARIRDLIEAPYALLAD